MLRTLLITASLLVVASVQAAPQQKCSFQRDADGRRVKTCHVYLQQERVLEDLTITPENGGINPAFAAYTISGRIEVGGNSCQADGLQPYLRQKSVAGRMQIVAGVEGWVKVNQACILIYDPVYTHVSLTVRSSAEQLSAAVIKNAEETGLLAPLSSPCFEPVFCTKEYKPTVCTLEGKDYRGDNSCEAQSKVEKVACLRNLETNDVLCQDEIFPF